MPQSVPVDHFMDRLRYVTKGNHGTWRGLIRALLGQTEFALGRLASHTRPDAAGVERLVFVCLGNINRSAFAEQIARALGANTCSIGLSTTTGAPAFHKAIESAPRFGINLSGHRATDIKDYEFQPTDLLLVMEIRHARRLVAAGLPPESIALLGHWGSPHRIHIHDPHTLSDAYFHTCFTLIQSAVLGLVADMRARRSPCLPDERLSDL